MTKHPEILFITRNYPPQIGGLEAYSYQLIRSFEKHYRIAKIVLGRSRPHLIWFVPLALARALFFQTSKRRVPVHLCDGMLSPIGVVLKALTGTRVSATVHGLDVTYSNPIYQKVIPPCLSGLDQLVCVSRATWTAACQRGVLKKKCTVIPNGIDPDAIYDPAAVSLGRKILSKRINHSLNGRRILLTIGRLVRRKGVAWFVRNVMPTLDSAWVYLVAGHGPEADQIQSAIRETGLAGRVFVLGRVSNDERNLLLNTADLFVMPNLRVKGDMEGFGITAIEAGSCGLPVVAGDLEGLRDAVIHGVTGYLIEAENREAFRRAVENAELDRDRVRGTVIEHFGWENIFRRYRQTLLPDSGFVDRGEEGKDVK